MITVKFNNPGLSRKYYVIKVSYVDQVTNTQIVGVNTLLETKLSWGQVCSILAAYVKDNYRLSVTPVENTKRFPAGYYESFTIDQVASDISRMRFIKHETVEEPKVVYVTRTITTEL